MQEEKKTVAAVTMAKNKRQHQQQPCALFSSSQKYCFPLYLLARLPSVYLPQSQFWRPKEEMESSQFSLIFYQAKYTDVLCLCMCVCLCVVLASS